MAVTPFVAGAWLPRGDGDTARTNRDPAHPDVVVAEWEPADPAIVSEIVARSRDAAMRWHGIGPFRRAAALQAIGDALDRASNELAFIIVAEVGKPLVEARAEVSLSANVAHFYAQAALASSGTVFPTDGNAISFTSRHPIGVVAAVTPFNFPLSIPAWKLLPALASGNAVIWKPAPAATGLAGRVTELLAEVLPAGVLSLLPGDGDIVDALIESPVDALTFTGSTSVGLSVAARCAARAIRVQCELGGKNATVVLADADLEAAARSCAASCFGYAGQKCTATSRLLIEDGVWERFLALLSEAVESLTFGDPAAPSTAVGPMIDGRARQRLADALADACTSAVPIVLREPEQSEGHYAPLAVVGPVDARAPLATDELFGPLVAAVAVHDLDEAVAVANAVPYGLAAAIHTSSLDKALGFASQVKAGLVRVNRTTTGVDYVTPFGGERRSGVGPRELGMGGLGFSQIERTVWLGPNGT